MRRILGSTAAAALLALALAAGGGAKATRTVKLAVGDTFTSAKTHIVCSVRLGSTLLPGQKQAQSEGRPLIEFNWQFHVPSGIYRAVTRDKHAVLTALAVTAHGVPAWAQAG